MAAEGKKSEPNKQITDKQRFTYIGFDVYPGTPKDLFKSDAEKSKHVEAVKSKREKGDVVRDECKLLEERVSTVDRYVLTFACIVILGTLFLPWFSAYNEFVEETNSEPISAVADSAQVTDSTLMAMSDSVNGIPQTMDSSALAAATNDSTPLEENIQKESSGEEIIHGYVAKKKIRRESESLDGYNILFSIGSVGKYVFGSGIVLVVTGAVFLLLLLVCLVLPFYTLYGLYGLKGDVDQRALALKKILKFNWIPVMLFGAVFILSFFGAEYGFDSQAVFTSLGDSYGPGVFLGSISYGVNVALGAFILTALKGVEI